MIILHSEIRNPQSKDSQLLRPFRCVAAVPDIQFSIDVLEMSFYGSR